MVALGQAPRPGGAWLAAARSGLGIALLALNGCQSSGRDIPGAQPPEMPAPVAAEAPRRAVYASQVLAPAPRVEFYIGMPARAAGLRKVQGPEGALWLEPQAILNRADITRAASVRTPDGRVYVQFDFNALGTSVLAKASSAYRGALLVLAIQGRVAHAARISAPMSQGRLFLRMRDDAAAQELLRRIRG